MDKCRFYPDAHIKRGDVAYSIFVNFDLPDARPVVIKDVVDSNPLFNQIQTIAGLGIMKLDSNDRFLPDSQVSGKEVFQIISRAKERSINRR